MNIEKDISKVVRQDGKSQIYLKLTINPHNRPRIKTGVFVLPKYFKPVKYNGRGVTYDIVIPHSGKRKTEEVREVMEAKSALDEFINRLFKICQVASEYIDIYKEWIEQTLDLLDKNNILTSQITYDCIKGLQTNSPKELSNRHIVSSKDKPANFSEAVKRYYTIKNLCVRRQQSYDVIVGMAERYELFIRMTRNKSFRFNYETLTKYDIEDFKQFMIDEYKLVELYPTTFQCINRVLKQQGNRKSHPPRQRGGNYMNSLMKRLSAVFNWLYGSGYISTNPLNGVTKGQENYGTPIYISIEERNKIANFDLSFDKDLETQRDIFIFQCLVGCRVSDLTRLTKDNITNNILEYVPKKTEKRSCVLARVPLCKQAQDLIMKYSGKDPKGRLFPFISDQNYNSRIKDIFWTIGITRMVQVRNPKTGSYESKPIADIASSHMARRTFVGSAYRAVKDPNIICKMSGHVEGSKAFMRYRTIDDSLLFEVIEAIS